MSPRPSIPFGSGDVFASGAGISVIVYASFCGGGATGWNRAATTCSRFIWIVQPPVPLQAPPQPSNCDPFAAVGVSVTLVPSLNVAEQVPPQSMPFGCDETVPLPVPVRMTVTACCVGGMATKVAQTWVSRCIVTAHPPGPLQPPPHPSKRKPAAGVAVSETDVPSSNDAAQICPQSTPAGLDRTEPCPLTPIRRPNRLTGAPPSIPVCGTPPSVLSGGVLASGCGDGPPVEPVPEEATGPQA